MPKAGEPMSEEHKAAMAEGRRKAAEAREAAQNETVARVTEAQAEIRNNANDKPSTDVKVTEAVGQEATEYGPHDDYRRIVAWDGGEYGVPYGEVLFLKEVEVFDAKAGRFIMVPKPFYRKATAEEMKPMRAIRDKRIAAKRVAASAR